MREDKSPDQVFYDANMARVLRRENDALRAMVRRLEEKLAEAHAKVNGLREDLAQQIRQDADLREYATNMRVLNQAKRRMESE